MTTVTAIPTFTPPVAPAPAVMGLCHDCDLDLDQACLATQVRASLDGPISVCDAHAAMHDDFADDELFGDLDVDGEVDLLDVAFTAGLLTDLGVAA